MTSPFGLGSLGDLPPPPPPRRRRGPLSGALLAALVVVVLLVLVVAVRVVQREVTDRRRVPPTITPTTVPEVPGTRTDAGSVLSACPTYTQPFPLPPLTCTQLSPPNLRDGERLPLVVLLHGFNTSPSQEIGSGGWDAAVVRRRFILAVPESNAASWNAGGCCGLSQSLQIDDIARIRSLIRAMKQLPGIDPARVFLVGNSNGGMMVYRFVCDNAGELAGAVSIEGTRVVSCTPKSPLRFLHVAGVDDMAVPYEGGQSLAAWVLGVSFSPVRASVDQYAEAQGCSPSNSSTKGNVATQQWACGDGVPLRLVSLQGWGHAWPTPSWYVATDELLDFLGVDR